MKGSIAILGGLSLVAARVLRRQDCPSVTPGTFIIEQYQLYPENADWDRKRCALYFGSLYNSSIAVYDPYSAEIFDIVEFEGITRNPKLHLGGVAADPYSNLLTVLVNAGAAFETGGRDVSGDNFIIKYHPDARAVMWQLNITALTKGAYGGFQDIETDVRGNTFIVGTYPGTILKVDPVGELLEPWYLPSPINHTRAGFAGLAATGDTLLTNGADGQIYRFDMTADVGTPTLVPRAAGDNLGASDAIYLPPRYNDRILLAAEPGKGVSVLRSDDDWQTVQYLGRVANTFPESQGGSMTATMQIGENIFAIVEYFTDRVVAGTTAGNRARFPMIDITDQIHELVGDE